MANLQTEQTSRPQGESREEDPRKQQGSDTSLQRGRGAEESRGALSRSAPASSPFSLIHRFLEDMDGLLDRSLFSPLTADLARSTSALFGQASWKPDVEVLTEADQIVVRADLPGVSREDLTISAEGDLLTLTGERRSEKSDTREGIFHSERTYGRFRRVVRLPRGTDVQRAEATFENGVLEIRIPAPGTRSRNIPIRGAAAGRENGGEDRNQGGRHH